MSQPGTTPSIAPLTALLTSLEAWVQTAKEKIIEVADAFIPEVVNDAEIALQDLAAISGGAVLKAATAALSGSEKFGQAVTDVVQTVEASGKTVAIQTAQMAVQQAYVAVSSVAQASKPAP